MAEPLKKLSLLVGSLTLSGVLLIGAFEVIQNVRYQQWRKSFKGTAWLGTVTVPSDNKALMWEYRPNATHKRITTNDFGFRDDLDRRLEKADGTLRIAFIGDSVTLGYGEEESHIFVRRFEEAFRSARSGQSIEALNFGIDGYSAPQVGELLRTRVMDFSPDWVVYALCLNDFDFATSAGDKVRYFRKPKSFFLVKLEHLIRRLRGLDFHAYKFEKNREEVFGELLRMRDILGRSDAGFLLAVIPIFPVEVNSFAGYPHEGIHRALDDFAVANGIGMTDALTAFRNAGGPPRAYANDVWHPNREGHRVIGESIAEILDRKLADSP
ncbi:MAG: SGNH/GDSL hydrolase family protein [Acidobacteriota bacterium]